MKAQILKYKLFIVGVMLLIGIPLLAYFFKVEPNTQNINATLQKMNVVLPATVQKKNVAKGITQVTDLKTGQKYIRMEKGVEVKAQECILPDGKIVSIVIPETKNAAFIPFSQTCKKLQQETAAKK